MSFIIPMKLAASCCRTPERAAWLKRLPDAIGTLTSRWSLTLGEPFDDDEVSCAWVAPGTYADGTRVVLKIGMPHMEGTHELDGLRFWNGNPTVRLLDADHGLNAMLLERCTPGTRLRALPEPEQDPVIAGLLRRLWRPPVQPHPFRPLSMMTAAWSEETLRDVARWPDAGLVREGLRLFKELALDVQGGVLLGTDLHAGNVLAAEREPWLVIDPKPFVGDPAYDVTQHLFNCLARLHADPDGMPARLADLVGVSRERVRLWAFARAAAEPREDWTNRAALALARALAP